MSMKSEMMQLRQQLNSVDQQYSEKPIGIIDDLCVEIDDLHKNINSLWLTALSEHVDLVKRLVASLKGFLPTTQLLVMSSNSKLTVAHTLLRVDEKGLSNYIEGNNFVPIPCHFGDATWHERLRNALASIPLPIEKP